MIMWNVQRLLDRVITTAATQLGKIICVTIAHVPVIFAQIHAQMIIWIVQILLRVTTATTQPIVVIWLNIAPALAAYVHQVAIKMFENAFVLWKLTF